MVSEQTKQLLGQVQLYQQQMQGILIQKESLNLQLSEIKNALEELEKSKETNIYKISGPLLIKTERNDIKKELKEKEELIYLRIKTLEKSELKIKSKIDEFGAKLKKSVPE